MAEPSISLRWIERPARAKRALHAGIEGEEFRVRGGGALRASGEDRETDGDEEVVEEVEVTLHRLAGEAEVAGDRRTESTHACEKVAAGIHAAVLAKGMAAGLPVRRRSVGDAAAEEPALRARSGSVVYELVLERSAITFRGGRD